MTRVLIVALLAVFVTGGIAPHVVSQEALKPNYFPHAKGSKWEYRRTFGTDIKNIAVRVAEDNLTVMKFTGDFEYLGLKEQMEVSGEGINYPAGERKADTPMPLLLRNTFKAGDEWDSLLPAGCGFSRAKATVNGPEDVEVPAGKFRAVKVTYVGRITGSTVTMPVWYADGVGVVKQVFNPTGSNIIIELTKYTPGK